MKKKNNMYEIAYSLAVKMAREEEPKSLTEITNRVLQKLETEGKENISLLRAVGQLNKMFVSGSIPPVFERFPLSAKGEYKHSKLGVYNDGGG